MTPTTTTAPLYTLQFRNGRILERQGPLALAQFQSDARLARYWPEAHPSQQVASTRRSPRPH